MVLAQGVVNFLVLKNMSESEISDDALATLGIPQAERMSESEISDDALAIVGTLAYWY